MTIELIITIIGTIVSLTGIYFKLENKVNILEERVATHKEITDDNFAKLIKSIDKLDVSIEKLNEKIEKINGNPK